MNKSDSKIKFGVLASGTGTTLQALLDGGIQPQCVISNNSQSGAIRRASKRDIPTYHISGKTHELPSLEDRAIADALLEQGCEFVFLAGYMKKIGSCTLAEFPNKIINTHPALLPQFGGSKMYGTLVHQAVLDARVSHTGATLHIVNEEYDKGPIITHSKTVEVDTADTAESLGLKVGVVEKEMILKFFSQSQADIQCQLTQCIRANNAFAAPFPLDDPQTARPKINRLADRLAKTQSL